jgi:hypothetical protein
MPLAEPAQAQALLRIEPIVAAAEDARQRQTAYASGSTCRRGGTPSHERFQAHCEAFGWSTTTAFTGYPLELAQEATNQ